MVTNDIRVAVRCPTNPKHVLEFIDRSFWEGVEVAFAEMMEEDWVGYVCEHGLP